jgi:hypothetical protein
MKGIGSFKSQIISAQKPRKRHNKPDRGRSRIDLTEVHKNIVAPGRQRIPASARTGLTKSKWIKGVFFALIAVIGFFLMGYLIAALSIGIYAKILLLVFVGILGFVSSHFVTSAFHRSS